MDGKVSNLLSDKFIMPQRSHMPGRSPNFHFVVRGIPAVEEWLGGSNEGITLELCSEHGATYGGFGKAMIAKSPVYFAKDSFFHLP